MATTSFTAVGNEAGSYSLTCPLNSTTFAASPSPQTYQSPAFQNASALALFNSPYEKVRSKTGTCFHGFEGDELGAYEALIDTFAQSPAFASHYFNLIHALEQTTATLPNVTCLACERFLNTFGREAGDIRTGHAADADMVCRLIVRVYSQTRDEGLQTRCLDVIDRMTQTRAFGFEKVLALYDR